MELGIEASKMVEKGSPRERDRSFGGREEVVFGRKMG
jgi:hypothetical protein